MNPHPDELEKEKTQKKSEMKDGTLQPMSKKEKGL